MLTVSFIVQPYELLPSSCKPSGNLVITNMVEPLKKKVIPRFDIVVSIVAATTPNELVVTRFYPRISPFGN